MAKNDIKIQDSTYIDENRKVVTVGGEKTSLSLARQGKGANVSGGLSVEGNLDSKGTLSGKAIEGDSLQITSGDINSFANDGKVTFLENGRAFARFRSDSSFQLISENDTGDYFTLGVADNGATELTTLDNGGANANLTLTIDGDLQITPAGDDVHINDTITLYNGASGITTITLRSILDTGDYSDWKTTTNGVTTITTVDDDGTDADLTLDVDGAIQLDSANGEFVSKNNGTEFSVTNSAYAGMIIGFTEMAYGTSSGRYDTTTSFVVINDNYDHGDGAEDHFLKVSFVVPPSNKVEIEVYLPYCSGMDGLLKMGLAVDVSATTLKAKFEVNAWDVDESDAVQVFKRWIIDGTDSGMEGAAWSAGESKTLYCMVKENVAGGRIFWGDSVANYGDMTMKATALPSQIGDGT